MDKTLTTGILLLICAPQFVLLSGCTINHRQEGPFVVVIKAEIEHKIKVQVENDLEKLFEEELKEFEDDA